MLTRLIVRNPATVAVAVALSLILAVSAGGDRPARAADPAEVRGYIDKATAAYALSRYAVAAENYEKAFELKPDPAQMRGLSAFDTR